MENFKIVENGTELTYVSAEPAGMKLVKVDRNHSRHYEGRVECPKCGGVGLIVHHVENGVPSWNWTDGGVCWKCLGSGKVHGKVIIRTTEYQAKLDAKAKERADKKKAEHEAKIAGIRKKWLTKNGWTEDGFTFLFLGNTFERKEEIKELGGKFNYLVGWYIDHEVEGFEFLKISKDLILFETYWGYDWKYDVDINSMKKAEEARLHPTVHDSEFQGKVKDRLKGLELTLTFSTTFESSRPAKYRGWHNDTKWFYSFKDASGNIFTWTASLPAGIDSVDNNGREFFKSIQVGDKVVIDGTVKDHKEYKGDKQTVLTRCKVQKIA